MFSPFDLEQLCLKGGLDAKLFAFHHPTDTSWPFVRWREKNFGRAEGPLYNQRTHFPVLSEKFFRSKERGLRFCSKRSFLLSNGQNESRCHDFVSRTFSSLPFNGHFSSKTWYPLSKNFSCSWFPLYLAKRIRDRFCPRFLEKVSETAKQSLCIAPNCPFYFPTDKMMQSVMVLS